MTNFVLAASAPASTSAPVPIKEEPIKQSAPEIPNDDDLFGTEEPVEQSVPETPSDVFLDFGIKDDPFNW